MTAEEFLIKQNFGSNNLNKKEQKVYFDSIIGHTAYINGMIEFAKMHVTEALKCAAKASESFDFSEEDELFKMNQENILTAYDLDNVV